MSGRQHGRHRGHYTWPTGPASDPGADDVYLDGTPIRTEERPCESCGLTAAGFDAPDPCLGYLDGVAFACCGHGVDRYAYVKIAVSKTGRLLISGAAAVEWFADRDVGPDSMYHPFDVDGGAA